MIIRLVTMRHKRILYTRGSIDSDEKGGHRARESNATNQHSRQTVRLAPPVT